MITEQSNKTLGLYGVDDIPMLREKLEAATRRKLPQLNQYDVEDAVSEAFAQHLAKVNCGLYEPVEGLSFENEMTVAAVSRAKDSHRKNPMTRMKREAKKQIDRLALEGLEPIRPKQLNVPPEDFFNEYAATKETECAIEKEDLNASLQGLTKEIFSVLPSRCESVLSTYLELLDCSQGAPVKLEKVSEVCGITPSGVHNAVKRAQGKLNRQHLELVEKYKMILNDRVTTFVTTL